MTKIPQKVIDDAKKSLTGLSSESSYLHVARLGNKEVIYLMSKNIKDYKDVIEITNIDKKNKTHLAINYPLGYSLVTDNEVKEQGGLENFVEKVKSGKIKLK